jgi:DNA integrity scanning protein DisA with diadenylate cyclase activity
MKPQTKSILSHAEQIAKDVDAKAVFVYGDVFPDPQEIREIAREANLVLVSKEDVKREEAEEVADTVLKVPPIKLTRMGQIKIAVLLALSQDLIRPGDVIVCLSGLANSDVLDTVMVFEVGEEFELFKSAGEQRLTQSVRPEVFERVIQVATELAAEGREGKAVGALFVVGDSDRVQEYCSQLVINPFRGYPEEERNVLDESLEETIKEFGALDGAFIIRGDGTILSAGTYLQPGKRGEKLPQGLGARHEAASSITASTDAIAVTISESTGTVTTFRGGKIFMEIEKPREIPEETPKTKRS